MRSSPTHPEVGGLTLGYESMQLEGTPGHRLISYYAEPGTPDRDATILLDMAGHERSSPSKSTVAPRN